VKRRSGSFNAKLILSVSRVLMEVFLCVCRLSSAGIYRFNGFNSFGVAVTLEVDCVDKQEVKGG